MKNNKTFASILYSDSDYMALGRDLDILHELANKDETLLNHYAFVKYEAQLLEKRTDIALDLLKRYINQTLIEEGRIEEITNPKVKKPKAKK